METDPDLEWEHYIALKLGMSVARLRTEMPNAEFLDWQVYFGRQAQRAQLEHARAQAHARR